MAAAILGTVLLVRSQGNLTHELLRERSMKVDVTVIRLHESGW